MKVLITGATSGIGKAIAELFASNNHELWITGRRKDRLRTLQTELGNACKINISAFDVRNLKSVQAWAEDVETEWQAPDLLINNAGLALGLSPIHEGDLEDWETMIDTNLKGLLYATRFIAPLMTKQKSGHIINIGSTAGKLVYPMGNVYCATKHAVDAASQGMRIDLMNHNIKVTNINPGMVDTEFSSVRFKGDEAIATKTYQGFEPLHAKDVADTVYYCATLPPHVCINDLTMTCTRQANGIFKTNDETVQAT